MNDLTELYLRQSITYERDEINVLKAKVKYLETQEFALVTDVVTLAVIDAKGDLLVGSADNAIDNLPVGTNAYALIADSAQTLGVKWAQLATGGIADLAVTTGKLADLGVTTGKLADLGVTTGKIADAAVTSAKLRNSAALSLIGRSANSSGVPADISAVAASGAVLRESGSVLGFGTILAAGIASDAVTTVKILDANVTNAKLANMADSTVKGRAVGAGTGVPTDLTATQLNAIWGSTTAFNANLVTLGVATDEGRGQMGIPALKLKGNNVLLYRESADSQPPIWEFLKRRSGTGTVLSSGDQLGSLVWTGADSTTFGAVGARINAEVDGTAGSADMPGRIVFLTSPDGTATPTEAMRIDSNQNLVIANGQRIESDELRARDSGGLKLYDDGGNLGIFIEDGGLVGVNTATPLATNQLSVRTASGAAGMIVDAPAGVGALYRMGKAGTAIWHFQRNGSDDAFSITETGVAVRLAILLGGNVGIGTTAPQGRLHGHDGTGGFLFTTKTAVAGTAIVVIPNGTGDVTALGTATWISSISTGGTQSNSVALVPGTTDQSIYAAGADILKLRCNADGSVDVRRTGGTATYAVTLWIVWQ